MIHPHVKRLQRLNRDVEVLNYVLVGFLLILAIQAVILVYEHHYDQLWALLPPATPLIAALLVGRVANRLIINGNITREDDRMQEIVRTTHHLIVITKDLRARVNFCNLVLKEGDRPAFALVQIAKTIEDRYETLLQREGYKYLPGKCVDIITRISGSIFGIGLLAEGVKHSWVANPAAALKNVSNKDSQLPAAKLDELMTDLEQLIEELFTLRTSIDLENKGKTAKS